MGPAPAPRRWHLGVLALAWTIFAVYGSLVPLRYTPVPWDQAVEQFRHLPPLWFGMGTRADWVANILLFIPLTFLWIGALTADRGRLARAIAALLVIPTAVAGAVALEFTQIWFHGRTVSKNDIVAETIGGMAGVMAWLVVGPRLLAWARAYSPGGRASRLAWVLHAYLLGLAVYSVIPLDLTVSLTELYGKFRRGAVLLIPFSYGYDSPATMVYQFFADVMEFVPVGIWAAYTQRARWRPWPPVLVAVVLGGAVAVTIEFAQLLVLSRFTDVTDIVLGTLGCAMGGWLVQRYDTAGPTTSPAAAESSGRRWALGLAMLAAYSLFLTLGFWYPFDVTTDRTVIARRLHDFFRLPFLVLYVGNEFNAITQVLIRLLLFAPVGALWGYTAGQTRSRLAYRLMLVLGLTYSVALAGGIEAGQILMPSKIADLTEVILCVIGATAGLVIERSLRHADAAAGTSPASAR